MISENEKNAIKNILEGSATTLISDYLSKNKIVNTFGNEYPPNYIRDVFNGLRENKILEAHIYDALEHYKEIYKERDERRKKLLQAG